MLKLRRRSSAFHECTTQHVLPAAVNIRRRLLHRGVEAGDGRWRAFPLCSRRPSSRIAAFWKGLREANANSFVLYVQEE